MQIILSKEEYEKMKRDYDNEIYRLEKEVAALRREIHDMRYYSKEEVEKRTLFL